MLLYITDMKLKLLIALSFCVIFVMIVANYATNKRGTYSKISPDFLWQVLSAGNPDTKNKPNQKTITKSKGEEATCMAMQELFGKPFKTIRPTFLKSPITGQNLEIDCYNESLKIGAEYNGRQHYEYVPKFHKSYQDFRNGQYRDYIKHVLCEKSGVKLIEIPYTVPIHKIKDYIHNKI